MFWAVVETRICPALVPWPVPGVAVNRNSQPVGALFPVAKAAVILRVTPEATVEEYWAAPRLKRFAYRLYRNPFILLGPGALVHFLILQRFPKKASRQVKS